MNPETTTPETIALYVTMFVSLAGVVTGAIALVQQTRKTRAETRKAEAETASEFAGAAESIVGGADKLVAHYEKQVSELRSELKEVRQEVKSLRTGVSILIRQLKEKGITPAWVPEEKNGS